MQNSNSGTITLEVSSHQCCRKIANLCFRLLRCSPHGVRVILSTPNSSLFKDSYPKPPSRPTSSDHSPNSLVSFSFVLLETGRKSFLDISELPPFCFLTKTVYCA